MKYFILKLLLLPVLVFSQKDSALVGKNEIGINMGPVAVIFLGSANIAQPYSLVYKRVLNKFAVRINYSFYPSSNRHFSIADETFKTSDTSFTIRSKNRTLMSHVVRLGGEYRRKFKRGWSLIAGLDLAYRYEDSKYIITDANFSLDSVHFAGTAQQYYQGRLQGQNLQFNQYAYSSQIGAGLTIAAMLPLSKRFVLTGQCRMDMFVGRTRETVVDNLASTKKSFSSMRGDFSTGPLLSELGLYYRF